MKQKKSGHKKRKKHKNYAFLSQMYSIFATNPDIFVFKKLSYEGEYNPLTDIISIDYRKEILSTLIHEVLHYLHLDWCETRVIREERKIMNSLSPCQIRTILKRFAKIL